MALSVKLLGFSAVCAAISAGISRIWLFDNKDYTFTQAAYSDTTGHAPYTAIAKVDVDDSGPLLVVKFERDEAEYTYTQSRKGRFSKYEHQLSFQLASTSLAITNFNQLLDAASACDGVGFIVQLVSGKILVMGEAIIGGAAIDTPMYVMQDGSTGTSGKVMDDFSGQNTVIKCPYKRGLIEYTGTLASLTALEA